MNSLLEDNPPVLISNKFCDPGWYRYSQQVGGGSQESRYSFETPSVQLAFDHLSPGVVATVYITHGPLRSPR